MLPELERGAADRAARARLAPVLCAGPWCWPPPAHPSYELAQRIAGVDSAPATPVAVLPAVSVDERCGHAWLAHLDAALPSSAEIGREARRSWDAAALALPRSVPLLWSAVGDAHAHAPRVLAVGTHLVGVAQATPCRVVQGPSFGLTFLLLQASRAFAAPLPDDIAASAAIREDGRLEPVGGLDVKLATIRALFPRVRRVLVAAAQADDEGLGETGLELVPVRSASQALDLVYGDALVALLLQAGTDPRRRQDLAEWFFRFSLVGRGELVDWAPVAGAAARARADWPDLTADQEFRIAFAQGVAERHEFNAGTLPVPEADWLASRPAPLRLQVLAHLVQQCADTGEPAFDALAPLLARFRQPDLREGQPMGWRLEGAVARHLAVSGAPREALARQAALTRAYVDTLSPGDASFPLAEWLRLSGALRDHDGFADADAMRRSLDPIGAFGLAGSAYIDLARARAALRLGVGDGAATLDRLHAIAADVAVASHVRWSAARAWIGAVPDAAGSAVGVALAAAAAEPDARRHHAARVAAALVALDAALAQGRALDSQAAIERLRHLEPGILRHLDGGASGMPLPDYVATYYPY